jgi:hypothetical protein
MSGKKFLLLVLALVLPVCIFLFLKFFGKNEFNVEPMFQDSVGVPRVCDAKYIFPYVIPDSIRQQLQIDKSKLTVVVLSDPKEKFGSQAKRIEEEFSSDPVQITWWNDANSLAIMKQCVFLMDDQSTVVLLDQSGSIRGQYDGTSLDEADRLLVEMKILLKKY